MNNIQKSFKVKSALRKAHGDHDGDEVACMADGGPVKGPGGPTEDKVPIAASHGEYVLPADTVQAIGVHNLDAVKDATHTPAQQMGSPLRRPARMKLANGGLVTGEATQDEFDAARHAQTLRTAAQQGLRATDGVSALRPAAGIRPIAPTPVAPASVTVPNNTGYGSVLPDARETALRAEQATQQANALHGPGVAEATQAEFDAARAAQAAPPAPSVSPLPDAAPIAEGVTADAKGASGAAKFGSTLRSFPGAIGSRVAGVASRAVAPIGAGLRIAGTAAIPAAAIYNAATDTPEQRAQASGVGGTGGENVGTLGSYLGSALTAGGVSPSDIGNITDTINRSISSGQGAAFQHVPRDRQGWLTRHVLDATGDNAGDQAASSSTAQKPMFITGDSGQVPDSAFALSAAAGAKQAADNARMQAIAATGGDPNSTYYDKGANDVVGQFNGKNITRGQSDALAGKIGLAGDPGAANTAAATSALRAPNLDAMGSGFNRINSSAGDINAHFDGLAKQIQQLHGSSAFHANGSLATKLLRLEEARAEALGRDQSNQVSSQGNQVSDLANKRSNASSNYGTDVAEQSALRRDGVTERDSARSTQVALNKQASDDADKNFQNTRQLISDIYPNDKDGNPTNGVAASKVTERLARNPLVVDPATGKQVDFTQASKAQQLQLLPALAAETQMADAANGSALFRHPNANATVIGTADPDLGVGGAINAILHGAGVASTANHIFNPTMTNDKLDTLDDGTVRFEGDLTGEDSTKRSILRARKGGN